jgi:hypothetical protein
MSVPILRTSVRINLNTFDLRLQPVEQRKYIFLSDRLEFIAKLAVNQFRKLHFCRVLL